MIFKRIHRLVFPAFILFLSSISYSHISNAQRELALGPIKLQEVTEEFGLSRLTSTFGAAAFDENNDGWPDLVISNHGKPPTIYLNQEGNGFRESEKTLLRLGGSDRHAPAVADYDNDGDQDIYFQHGSRSGTGRGPKELFINEGPGKPFHKRTSALVADAKGRGRTGVWFDYDGDGLLDLYLAHDLREDAPNRLLRNLGNGNFSDVSVSSGLDLHIDTDSGTAIAGDVDNDGDMDLLLNGTDRPYLFINNSQGFFRDETVERGIPLIDHVWSSSLSDYNNDGFLDLYLTRGAEFPLEGATLGAHRLNFMQQVGAKDDRTDILNFQTQPGAVLNFVFYKTLFTSFVDINNIYVGAQGRNPRKPKFTVGQGALSGEGIPVQWKTDGSQKGTFIWRDANTGRWTIAAASGDSELFHSGALLTSASSLTALQQSGMEAPIIPQYPNVLLENHEGRFTEVTNQRRLGDPSNGRDSVWLDLNNDGNLDLFIVNAGFNGHGKQPNSFYLNQGSVFKQFRLPMLGDEKFGHGDGAVMADFNLDGFLDLFIVNGAGALPNSHGPYQLFLNRTPNRNNWIGFDLIGRGKNYANRDAVGAKIKIDWYTGRRTSWGYILGGSGSNSQSSRTVHFGLGNAEGITAHIFWPQSKTYPNGHVQVLQFGRSQLNRNYEIRE